jgi:hypothetical protein
MEFLPVLELIDRLCIARVKYARTQGAGHLLSLPVLLDAPQSLPLREAREIFERDYLVAQINRFGRNFSGPGRSSAPR